MGKNYRREKAKQRVRMQDARMAEARNVSSSLLELPAENQHVMLNSFVISPRMSELAVVAESAGYVVRDVPGDGDCMFASLAITLRYVGLHYTSQQLRQMVAGYLKDNPFVNGDPSNPRWNFIDAVVLDLPGNLVLDRKSAWKLYLQKIAKCYSSGGIWGDEMALKACADMLQVKIQIYRYDGVNYEAYGCQYDKEIALGYVLYEGEGEMRGQQVGEHYCALIRPVQSVSDGNQTREYSRCLLRSQKCQTAYLTQLVCGKTVKGQVQVPNTNAGFRKRQVQKERQSACCEYTETYADISSHKKPVVDSNGYQLVQKRKHAKQLEHTESESVTKNVKNSVRLHVPTVVTRNRFYGLVQEPVSIAPDAVDTDKRQPCSVVKGKRKQRSSMSYSVTLDEHCSNTEDTVSINDTVTQRVLQRREMARLRQEKKRKAESNQESTLRRQKELESIRRRHRNESEQEKTWRKQKALDDTRRRRSNESEKDSIVRREKSLDHARRRLSNESEEESIARRQKSLDIVRRRRSKESDEDKIMRLKNVRLQRRNESIWQKRCRLESNLKRVHQHLLAEDIARRMKRLEKCRHYMSGKRRKLRVSKYQAKLARHCIRVKMLVQERMSRQARVVKAAGYAVMKADHIRVKAAQQKWRDEKKREMYWKKVYAAGGKFEKSLKAGLCCVCVCCHRLLYRRSVRKFDVAKYSNRVSGMVHKATAEPLSNHFQRNHICFTCDGSLRRGKLPAQSKANDLVLDAIPDELQNLTTLERHTISRRIPFMKLISLPRGKQLSIHGPAVNVPTAVVPVTTILPRSASDDSLLPLKLKRKLAFRGHYMYGNINVRRVNSALQWLMSNNDLYQDVAVSEDWQKSWKELDNDVYNCNKNDSVKQSEGNTGQVFDQQCVDTDAREDIETADDEDLETNRLRGIPYDTCLQREDDDDSGEKIISVAPGEQQQPIGILEDKFFEEMAFPDKFPLGSGGIASKERPVDLTPRRYFQQRILDVDGRFSADTDYLFAAQYAIENKQLRDNVNIMLRQTKGGSINGRKVTASLVRDPQHVSSFVRNDHAFRSLTTVRGSPAYWKRASLDLLAMIRQLGIPTWFMTLSAADLQWPDVIQLVARQYGETLSDEQICSMSWEEKCSYIRRNPVVVARHYDFRLKTFFNDFLKSNANPVGKLAYYFYRIEFQQRGSPHVHMLLWVSGAPVFDQSPDREIRQFVDQYQTCGIPMNDDELKNLVLNLQKHSHSKNCRMKDGTCRYNFPHVPLDRTTVARGTLSGPTELLMEPHRADNIMTAVRQLIEKHLQNDPENIPPLTAVLAELGIPADMYEWAVSTTVARKKICLKRTTQEMMINSYCPAVLKYWKANMDIQFVLDAYACVVYITSYMLKDERNLSELLMEAARESAETSVREQLNKVGSCFLNHREVSAQEAVYRLLSLHLKESNCSVVFVNTSPPESRVSMLRPFSELVDCDSDDEDVFKTSLIDRYAARPEELESMCLADFASQYISCTESSRNKSTSVIQLKNSAGHVIGYMRKRKKAAVIRFPSFKRDQENYFRSKLMLFTPWRNEAEDLYGEFDIFVDRCVAEKKNLQENERRFVKNGQQLEQAFEDLEKANRDGGVQHGWDEIAPSAAAENFECDVEGPEDVNVFDEHVVLFKEQSEKQTSTVDNSAKLRARFTVEANERILSDEEYLRQLESLNAEQKKAVLFNKQWCNKFVEAVNKSLPRPEAYQLFLSGPGGVGKSHVIRLVHTDCVKLLRSCRPLGEEMFEPDDICVLLAAPTGTAAFNIGGMTIHSALLLNPDNSKLSADKLNTLQSVLCKLMVLIIDEISMCGSDFLIQIDKRLRLVKGCDKAFGGVSILAVGDLYQLPPVRQPSVFSVSRDPMCQLQGSVWTRHFQLLELTQNMRQRDQEFAQFLNRVRVGLCTDTDEKLMSTRIIPFSKDHPQYPIDVTHIFGTNKECHQHNMYCLERTGHEIFSLKAVDSKYDKLTKLVKTVDIVKDNDIGGLKQEILVADDARVMLIANLDISDGLCNGVTGTVRGVIRDCEKITALQVQFDSTHVGQQAMKANSFRLQYPNCVCIRRHSVSSSYGKGKNATVTRSQFPLCLAFACTIHKVQGMTMDQVVISMKSRFFPGQAYVALSRVRTLQGLHLLDFDKKKIMCNRQVSTEMDRLRQRSITVIDSAVQ